MKSTLNILCLEDMADDFEWINYTLKKSGLPARTTRVDTREEFVAALHHSTPDIVLSDHALPAFNSIEALALCRTHDPDLPFILVTGAVSDEFAVNCIKKGADDYILKSNLTRLPSAIRAAIRYKTTEREKRKAYDAVEVQNQELRKINHELDTFVYSISHNLRAPMMSVLGLIRLAKEETDLTTLHQYHGLMETCVHKLDDTLKEILDYSRNARHQVLCEPVDLRKMINDTLEKMRFIPGYERMAIRVNVTGPVEFYSDPFRISVIVNNLISNAIKYQDELKDHPEFQISVEVSEASAVFEFEDNGIGIHADLIPQIFNMFYRATGKKEGSGLGLYIVKEAVEKLNGRVTVHSVYGKETKFRVEIPNQLSINKSN